jgi:hypothetical protein
VANKQSGAVEENEKNLASHNRNVPVWEVAIQDQETANKRVKASESDAERHGWRRARQAQSRTRQWVTSKAYSS